MMKNVLLFRTKLNQADFAMSRIVANESYGGNMLRVAFMSQYPRGKMKDFKLRC